MNRFSVATIVGLSLCACADRAWQPELVESIDVTSDFHHRAQAGLFLFDREPVVVRVLEEEKARLSRSAYFCLRSELGTLWVRGDDADKLVVYMDTESFFSHWQVGCELSTARVFAEWPKHPIE